MVEFSNLIRVSLLSGSKKSYEFVADEITFEPSVSEENGGRYWDCGKTFVVDLPDSDIMDAFEVPRYCILSLSALLGRGAKATVKEYKIGSEGVPAMVSLVSHLNKAKLVLSCKMLTDPLR